MKHEEFEKIKKEIEEAVNKEIPDRYRRRKIKAVNERLIEAIEAKKLERSENSKYVIFTYNVNLGDRRFPDYVKCVVCREIARETEKSFLWVGQRVAKEPGWTGVIGYAE